MAEKWIDIGTAKEVLRNTCNFEKDEVADFKIVNGKEAVLLSIYTDAFFLLNEKFKFKFRPILGAWNSKESLNIIPFSEDIWSISEVIPIFGSPLSSYFRFFPDLSKPKYLFMVDGRSYSKPRDRYSSVPFRELHGKEIVKDILEKIKAKNINPTDCLVWISNPDGTFGEDFWEYISGVVLRNRGYFITKYGNSDDLNAYYIPEYLEKLTKKGFLNKGAFIEELEMLEKGNKQNIKLKSDYEAIPIEAESSDYRVRSHSQGSGVGQIIYKQFEYGTTTRGIVTGPFCTRYEDIHCQNEKCSCKAIGLISCDEKGNLVYLPPLRKYSEISEENIELIKNLIKCSLLRNLTFEERCKLMGIRHTNLKDYFEKTLNLDIDIILDKIEEKNQKWLKWIRKF